MILPLLYSNTPYHFDAHASHTFERTTKNNSFKKKNVTKEEGALKLVLKLLFPVSLRFECSSSCPHRVFLKAKAPSSSTATPPWRAERRWLGSHRFLRWTFGDSKSHQRKNGKRKFMFDAFILSNLINVWQQRLIKLLLYFNSICFYEDGIIYHNHVLTMAHVKNIHQPPPKQKTLEKHTFQNFPPKRLRRLRLRLRFEVKMSLLVRSKPPWHFRSWNSIPPRLRTHRNPKKLTPLCPTQKKYMEPKERFHMVIRIKERSLWFDEETQKTPHWKRKGVTWHTYGIEKPTKKMCAKVLWMLGCQTHHK